MWLLMFESFRLTTFTRDPLPVICLVGATLLLSACDDGQAPAAKEPPRQSFVVTVQQAGQADFKVLASIPERWDSKSAVQGLSQALFAARASCGSLGQDAPDHALTLVDGKVSSVQTNLGAPPSCFAAELTGKTITAAGNGFTGTIYLRTHIEE